MPTKKSGGSGRNERDADSGRYVPKGTEKEKDVSSRVQMVTRESDGRVSFDTRDRAKADVVVHRNVIKKN